MNINSTWQKSGSDRNPCPNVSVQDLLNIQAALQKAFPRAAKDIVLINVNGADTFIEPTPEMAIRIINSGCVAIEIYYSPNEHKPEYSRLCVRGSIPLSDSKIRQIIGACGFRKIAG
jgi:hypothetical protein